MRQFKSLKAKALLATGVMACFPSAAHNYVRFEKETLRRLTMAEHAIVAQWADKLGIQVSEPGERLSALAKLELEAELNGISKDLALSLIAQESRGNPNAVSKAGAKGLMQLMPETIKKCGIRDPFDVHQNIECGVWWLAKMHQEAKGRLVTSLELYNGGPKCTGGKCAETRDYVPAILNAMNDGKTMRELRAKLEKIA